MTRTRPRPHSRLAIAALALAVLAGCSSTPPRITVPKGEPLAISVHAAPPSAGPLPISNQAMGNNVGTGATTGGVSGGLLGLGCGPLLLVCVPVFMSLGALTGTAAGAVVGATGSLSATQADQVRARLTHLRQSHDLTSELDKRLVDAAGRHWQITTGGSARILKVELKELWLGSTRDERIGYVMSAGVQVAPESGSTAPAAPGSGRAPAQKIYEYVSPLTPLSVWLDEQSDFLDANFSTALQELASQIVLDLMPS